ncbi:hypothetical protein [Streptomyces sp. NPDC050548]|uniref:hypothetical protein n=1 Tax=Streptomyces sp. NPDC050548 TaxID=3365629 RepID=UPI0037B7A63E
MTFDQSSWQLHNSRVYNIAGDLRLTEQSGPAEFAEAVAELRSRIGALEGVPESERTALDAELADIAEDALGGTHEAGDGAGTSAEPDAEGSDDTEDTEGLAGPDDTEATPGGTDDAVTGRLTRLAHRLRALRGTAAAATELGNTVDELARWAGGHHF